MGYRAAIRAIVGAGMGAAQTERAVRLLDGVHPESGMVRLSWADALALLGLQSQQAARNSLSKLGRQDVIRYATAADGVMVAFPAFEEAQNNRPRLSESPPTVIEAREPIALSEAESSPTVIRITASDYSDNQKSPPITPPKDLVLDLGSTFPIQSTPIFGGCGGGEEDNPLWPEVRRLAEQQFGVMDSSRWGRLRAACGSAPLSWFVDAFEYVRGLQEGGKRVNDPIAYSLTVLDNRRRELAETRGGTYGNGNGVATSISAGSRGSANGHHGQTDAALAEAKRIADLVNADFASGRRDWAG